MQLSSDHCAHSSKDRLGLFKKLVKLIHQKFGKNRVAWVDEFVPPSA